MSYSPFLSPGRRARQRARAHRRRRIAASLVAVVAIGVAWLLIGTTALSGGRRSSAREHQRATAGAHAKLAFAPTISPHGFPLSAPALALAGIGSPVEDPVRVSFRVPPRAGLLFNLTTGQVLWQRNPFIRVPIASLTKMMTALLTVQSAPPRAPVLITREAVEMPGSKVGVLPLGHHVALESLLYGLLLPSGNDAAVALAQHVAGSVNAFVLRMNQEAAKLGLGCTRYSSPSGYYDKGNFSCAADLAVLAHVDMLQPRIASVVHTYSAAIPFPIHRGKLYLYNNNPLLIYGYPGATGLKTGETEAAGRCLVATATRDGVSLGAIVLNSQDPGTQARELLDLGFEHVYHQAPVPEAPFPPGA